MIGGFVKRSQSKASLLMRHSGVFVIDVNIFITNMLPPIRTKTWKMGEVGAVNQVMIRGVGQPMQLWQLQFALWQLPLQITSLHTVFPAFPRFSKGKSEGVPHVKRG